MRVTRLRIPLHPTRRRHVWPLWIVPGAFVLLAIMSWLASAALLYAIFSDGMSG
jgi:hypothetical protein